MGQDFSKLALGVELLQLRAQTGAFGRVWEMLLISGFYRDLGLDAVCVLPCSQLPVGFRARLNARFEPGAPSTPGGLGYLMVERLMDLGRTGSCFLGLCFEVFLFIGLR